MKIAIDLDQTILDCVSLIYQISNKLIPAKFKKRLKYAQLDSNNKSGSHLLISKMQKAECYYDIEDAIDVINYFFDDGDEIVLLSSRPNFASLNRAVLEILNKLQLPYHSLYVKCSNKTLFCLKESVDVLVDNTYKICKHASDNFINTIFYNPNMLKVDNNSRIVNATSWLEILKAINKFKRAFNSLNRR